MWINVEVWDATAKDNLKLFRKGSALNGLGTLIFNKWIDKESGEERKMFKYRLLKLMSPEEMKPFDDIDSLTFSSSNSDDLVSTPMADSVQPDVSQSEKIVIVGVETVTAVPAVESVKPASTSSSDQVEKVASPEAVAVQTPPEDVWRKYEPAKQVSPTQDTVNKWEKKVAPAQPAPTPDAVKKWVPSKQVSPPPQETKSNSRIVLGSYDPDME